jgi:hypothetical protein
MLTLSKDFLETTSPIFGITEAVPEENIPNEEINRNEG